MLHARPDYNRIQDPENKIPSDEPVFLLRAQDKTASAVVRFWASLNAAQGDLEAVRRATIQADRMDKWTIKKWADLPPL